jgi:hypothetical protein
MTNVLTENETSTACAIDDFDLARQLVLSYLTEDEYGEYERLVQALLAVRITCSRNSLRRILVLLTAVSDPRFDEYGAANVLPILRCLELTDDLQADVETLLENMRREDTAAYEQAQREYAEITSPFRQAAIRLLTKYGRPTYPDVERELNNL